MVKTLEFSEVKSGLHGWNGACFTHTQSFCHPNSRVEGIFSPTQSDLLRGERGRKRDQKGKRRKKEEGGKKEEEERERERGRLPPSSVASTTMSDHHHLLPSFISTGIPLLSGFPVKFVVQIRVFGTGGYSISL